MKEYSTNIWKKKRIISKTDYAGIVSIGVSMYLASSFQQIGISETSATNAAFITSMYVIIVPIISYIFLSDPPHWSYFISGFSCLFGIYLLGGSNFSSFGDGDSWILASAFFYAIQVVLIGIMISRINTPVFIATVQFFITGILFTLLILGLFYKKIKLSFKIFGK